MGTAKNLSNKGSINRTRFLRERGREQWQVAWEGGCRDCAVLLKAC